MRREGSSQWRSVLAWDVDVRRVVNYNEHLERGWGWMKEQKMQPGNVHKIGDKYYEFQNTIRSARLTPGVVYGCSYHDVNSGFDIFRYKGIMYTEGASQAEAASIAETLQHFELRSMKDLYTFELYKNWQQPDVWSRLDAQKRAAVTAFFEQHPNLVQEPVPEIRMLMDHLNADGIWDTDVDYFYLYEGYWAGGSGAERLTFWDVEEVTVAAEDT